MSSFTPAFEFKQITEFAGSTIRAFDCGNAAMNTYFHRMAKTNHKTGLSPCHVMVEKGTRGPILGYATLSQSSVEKGDPPSPPFKKFPNYPIPVTLIGRLAISSDHQRRGFGEQFLMHIFYASASAVRDKGLGSVGIITDAIDQRAVNFYSRYDFQILLGQNKFPKRMFIPNATIFDAIDS